MLEIIHHEDWQKLTALVADRMPHPRSGSYTCIVIQILQDSYLPLQDQISNSKFAVKMPIFGEIQYKKLSLYLVHIYLLANFCPGQANIFLVIIGQPNFNTQTGSQVVSFLFSKGDSLKMASPCLVAMYRQVSRKE